MIYIFPEFFNVEYFYFSWDKNKLRIGKSENWRVSSSGISLTLDHLASGQSYPAVPRAVPAKHGHKNLWCHMDSQDKLVKISCLDVRLK